MNCTNLFRMEIPQPELIMSLPSVFPERTEMMETCSLLMMILTILVTVEKLMLDLITSAVVF